MERRINVLEQDRWTALGKRLWARGKGCIDLRTNLVEYQGKTSEQAGEIIAKLLVEYQGKTSEQVDEIMAKLLVE